MEGDCMYENYGGMMNIQYGNHELGISPTKKSIQDYVCLTTGCSSYEVVEEFETSMTRHICPGSKVIKLLNKAVIPVPTSRGMINVEVFFCPMCKKLIINKASMEVY